MPPHVPTNFRGPPSWLWRKCNRLLRLGRRWGAVTLSRWCEGWYIGRWGARRGLKSRSTNYPDHGHHGDPPPTRKIPMVEPGIEPGTSWLVVRSSDHEAIPANIKKYILRSHERLAMGWTVREWKPRRGEIFHTRPDHPWGPPSLLHNGYRVFPGGKAAGAWRWTPTLQLAPRLKKE